MPHRPDVRPAPLALLLALLTCGAPLHAQQTVKPTATAERAELAPPTDAFAAQPDPGSIVLRWTAAPRAAQYRIYLASGATADDAARLVGTAPGATTRWVVPIRPEMRGVEQRFFIESVAAGNRASERAAFPPVTPQYAAAGPAAMPTNVEARETGPGTITVTWTPVPGATAYAIGRSIRPEGFRPLCPMCPPTSSYVDTAAANGAVHVYSVTALSAQGPSRPVSSNEVTPTGTVVADGGGSGGGGSGGGGTGGGGGGGTDTTTTTTTTGTPTHPPPPPQQVTATLGGGPMGGKREPAPASQATVRWSTSPGASSYTVTRIAACPGVTLANRVVTVPARRDRAQEWSEDLAPLLVENPGCLTGSGLTARYAIAAVNAAGSSSPALSTAVTLSSAR